jgi:hypothetical protein
VTNRSAYLLRENTGTTGLELTAKTAVETLADHLDVHPSVKDLYLELWDDLRRENDKASGLPQSSGNPEK